VKTFRRNDVGSGLRRGRRWQCKGQRLNIRLSAAVLDGLRARAGEERIAYQTLTSSVLHKFVTGRLVETRAKASRRTLP
jgi:hypothetical protein